MGGGEAGVPDDLLTTKGDTHGYSTTNARVPIGSNTQVLTADSTEALGLKWATPTDISPPTTTKGDLSGFSTLQARIPIGANSTLLMADSTEALGLEWSSTVNEATLTDLKRIQRELGTTLGTTGTIDLDFTTNELQLMPAMTGAVVFTGSNYVAGGSKTIRIIGGASAYGFTFPAGWKFVNESPTDLAIGKYAVLTLTSTTAAEAGVICAYAVEA